MFILIVLLLNGLLHAFAEFQLPVYTKCCNTSEKLEQKNGTDYYSCVKYEEIPRIFVASEKLILLPEDFSGQCIDYSDEIFFYNARKGLIINKEEVLHTSENKDTFYPKCCPVGYNYEKITHSCIKSSEKLITKHSFIKIGLPHCKLIVDYYSISTNWTVDDKNFSYVDVDNKRYSRGNFCLDESESGSSILRVCLNDLDVCKQTRCLHKCCPDGQSFVNGSNCKNTYEYGLDISAIQENETANGDFALIHGHSCHLYILNKANGGYNIDKKGIFSMQEKDQEDDDLIWRYFEAKDNVYCIEHATKQSANLKKYAAFRCFMENEVETKFSITRWAMIVSCLFMVFTISVYAYLNKIDNLFAKTLICYCLSLLIGFSMLSYLAFDLRAAGATCITIGFLSFYWMFCGFAWLNVMSVDIYLTVGSLNSVRGGTIRGTSMKRFFKYCLYAWSVPLIFTILSVIFYLTDCLPPSIAIDLGNKCVISRRKGNYAHLLFVGLPLTIFQMINIVLFIKTVVYCLEVKNGISNMSDTQTSKHEKSNLFRKHKERFSLILKLSIVMGISFLFEVVSTFFDFKHNPYSSITSIIEIVWDTINSLQGVLIFLIFVCKRKIYSQIKKIWTKEKEKCRKISSGSTMSTQLTTTKITRS